MNLLGFIMSLVHMQAVHGWLSAYERLVNSQKFFSPYLTQEDISFVGTITSSFGFYFDWNDVEGKLENRVEMSAYKEYLAYTATAEYDYDVDAVSGTVCGTSIEYFAENETVRPGQQPASPETVASAQGISREKARSIALSDASLSAADVTFTKTKLDREDGMLVYEIEFVTAAAEYEYEIDAVTGAIRERSIETRATAQPAASSYIGVDQAKSIALKHAGLSAAEVSFTKAKLEKDDGLRKYEIEFIKGSTEYEYEIDAATGSILEYKTEQEEGGAPTQSKVISLDQAKSAALKHAGLSASNVTFTKAKLDDGKYEIEFIKGSTEYEYEIDAATGSVLEYDVERSEPAPSNDNRQPDRDDDHDDDDDD